MADKKPPDHDLHCESFATRTEVTILDFNKNVKKPFVDEFDWEVADFESSFDNFEPRAAKIAFAIAKSVFLKTNLRRPVK